MDLNTVIPRGVRLKDFMTSLAGDKDSVDCITRRRLGSQWDRLIKLSEDNVIIRKHIDFYYEHPMFSEVELLVNIIQTLDACNKGMTKEIIENSLNTPIIMCRDCNKPTFVAGVVCGGCIDDKKE